jgi:methionyl aminopeptidase
MLDSVRTDGQHINREGQHRKPLGRKVESSEVVNIDVSAELDGYLRDTGATFAVPAVDPRIEYLCQITLNALNPAMEAVRAGAKVNPIGQAIEKTAIDAGFNTIRDLGSHGIGRSLHEEPHFIQKFYDKSDTRTLSEGQVITIEPFLFTGAEGTVTADDG